MAMANQLKEELYAMALRKLNLEKEISSMDCYIKVLKRELDQRMPTIQII